MKMEQLEFLLAVKEYIEPSEYRKDWESGGCRTIDELIADDEMPPVCSDVINRINAA